MYNHLCGCEILQNGTFLVSAVPFYSASDFSLVVVVGGGGDCGGGGGAAAAAAAVIAGPHEM